MMRPRSKRKWHRVHARAFSLAETAVCILIISGMLVAALDTLGASSGAQRTLAERSTANLLARDLMAEITGQNYEDPDGSPVFGPESDEIVGGRALYDDVDDYRAWSAAAPVREDGSPIPGYDAFARSATVEWVLANDVTVMSPSPTNVKRITVTVTRAGSSSYVLAELVAIRTAGPPPPNDTPVVLLVVVDDEDPTSAEQARITLIESWGFSVALISADDSQAQYDAAVADAVVAYVPPSTAEDLIGTKLRDAPIGVVNGDAELLDDFGFCSSVTYTNVEKLFVFIDFHYITTGLPFGWNIIYTSSQPVFVFNGSVAPSLIIPLGGTHTGGAIPYGSTGVIDTGGQLYDGGTAAARRVQLPWGGDPFDFSSLNDDGKRILQRSIEWAAEMDTGP